MLRSECVSYVGDVKYPHLPSLVYRKDDEFYKQVPTGAMVIGRLLHLFKSKPIRGPKQWAYLTVAEELRHLAVFSLSGYPLTLRLVVQMVQRLYEGTCQRKSKSCTVPRIPGYLTAVKSNATKTEIDEFNEHCRRGFDYRTPDNKLAKVKLEVEYKLQLKEEDTALWDFA